MPKAIIGALIVFGVLAAITLIHVVGSSPRRRR